MKDDSSLRARCHESQFGSGTNSNGQQTMLSRVTSERKVKGEMSENFFFFAP